MGPRAGGAPSSDPAVDLSAQWDKEGAMAHQVCSLGLTLGQAGGNISEVLHHKSLHMVE